MLNWDNLVDYACDIIPMQSDGNSLSFAQVD